MLNKQNCLMIAIACCGLLSSCGPSDNVESQASSQLPEEMRTLLQLHNEIRQSGAACSDQAMSASSALKWNPLLAKAAQRHTKNMADKDHFSHTGTDGSSVKNRIEDVEYKWARYGENLSFGQTTAQAAIDGWLMSEYHCKNILHPEFTEMGAARVDNYWTVVFGALL